MVLVLHWITVEHPMYIMQFYKRLNKGRWRNAEESGKILQKKLQRRWKENEIVPEQLEKIFKRKIEKKRRK